MVTSTLRRGLVGLATGAISLAGLAVAPAHADEPSLLPLDTSGTLIGWYSPGSEKAGTLPSQYASTPFSQVSSGTGTTVAVTAAGKLVGWGSSQDGVWDSTNFPTGVDGHIHQIQVTASVGLAVKDDGTVVSWPKNAVSPAAKIPAGLTGVESVSMSSNSNAYALMRDGSVRAWGDNSYNQTDVPSALRQPGAAIQVVGGSEWAAAVTSDHRVVVWGRSIPANGNIASPPSNLTAAGSVDKIVAAGASALALRTDHTVQAWGDSTEAGNPTSPESTWTNDPPASLEGKTVVDISQSTAVTDQGEVIGWNVTDQYDRPTFQAPPASLQGRSISLITRGGSSAWAIVASVGSVAVPTITGTVKSGQTLTGTPGTFSGGGTVTNQWLANGTPIASATGTTLALTDALVGKTISLRSTATKGTETASSTSVATAPVAANQAASTIKATSTAGTYGATAPRISVTITPSSATGSVTAYRGTTKVGTGTVKAGKTTISPTKTAIAAGSSTLTLKYAGDANTAPSQGTVKVTVKKAKASITAKSATKTIKAKKTKAKISVTVKATGVTPTGTVTAYLGKTKIGSGKLSKGKATITVKAFKKSGKNKVTLKYAGSSSANAASKSLTLTVKK